jgi:gluconate 2-dehydrogenase alpha chain
VTSLRDAIATGNVTLRANSMVKRLVRKTVGGRRRITQVVYLNELGRSVKVAADLFVLAASPIESARIALLSGLDQSGWGNRSGQLGRNLMFHYQTLAFGVFAERLHPWRGRVITHMLDDFCGPAELAGYAAWPFPRGGTLELGGTQDLVGEGKNYQRGGLQHKHLMRVSPTRDRLTALTMQGEDLPQEGNRVDLDPAIRDVYGLPVPRITYASHPFELEASAFWLPTILDVLRAAGAVFTAPLGGDAPKGQLPGDFESGFQQSVGATGAVNIVPTSRHIMGVFRMSATRETGVTNPYGRFWDIDNLYSCDGAVFPTSGGMNPSLTVMALAHRTACAALSPDGDDPLGVMRDIDQDLL